MQAHRCALSLVSPQLLCAACCARLASCYSSGDRHAMPCGLLTGCGCRRVFGNMLGSTWCFTELCQQQAVAAMAGMLCWAAEQLLHLYGSCPCTYSRRVCVASTQGGLPPAACPNFTMNSALNFKPARPCKKRMASMIIRTCSYNMLLT